MVLQISIPRTIEGHPIVRRLIPIQEPGMYLNLPVVALGSALIQVRRLNEANRGRVALLLRLSSTINVEHAIESIWGLVY